MLPSLWKRSKEDDHGRRASTSPCPNTPSLLVQFLSLSAYLSCMYSFTLSFYFQPSSPPRTHNFTHIHFLYKLFTILPLNMIKLPQSISFHPFHYTLNCMLLSGDSSPQYALSTAVPNSMSKSLIYMLMLAEYCSLNLSLLP